MQEDTIRQDRKEAGNLVNGWTTFPLALLIIAGCQLLPGPGTATVLAQQGSNTARQSHNHPSVSKNRSKATVRNRSAAEAEQPITIRARPGDTLTKIAARLNVPVNELAERNGLTVNSQLRRGERLVVPASAGANAPAAAPAQRTVVGKRITFDDGTTLEADDVWKRGDDVWYTRRGVSNQVTRPVRNIEPITVELTKENKPVPAIVQVNETKPFDADKPAPAFLIYLVGGACLRADEVKQSDTGTWYRRANLSIFLEPERIARIEREGLGPKPTGWAERGWTSGNASLDQLIRNNGARFGVDPYLIFCVIEQESQFHVRAVSPKGARGLMQLMPGTMARYGIRNGFDPAANVFGGTLYLKELLTMFSGRLDLVLASYNAGEGAVMTHGRQVPPYKETRDYVRRISRRYGNGDSKEPRPGGRTDQ